MTKREVVTLVVALALGVVGGLLGARLGIALWMSDYASMSTARDVEPFLLGLGNEVVCNPFIAGSHSIEGTGVLVLGAGDNAICTFTSPVAP